MSVIAAYNSKAKERTWLRSPLALLSIAVMACGFILLGQGLWIHTKAYTAQILLERAFTQSIATGEKIKPWSWADTWPVARIEAPRLAASAIALNGASGQALAFGPGHLQNTPQAGEQGTAIYAAHRDTHFAFLKDIEKDDLIRITRNDGKTYTYRATQMSVARWDEPQIDVLASGSHLVLATCYPFDAVTQGPLRYLVYADLAE
ncbi:class GN sortase [Brucella pituitosa]|uniref:class GN sortase n=1 Tax=Brucella pituitosa TaxID=571256 RepID=UPI000C26FBE6|nr:class GN sortase [Brucella pituitosa]MCK4206163.1 class GN sortase [Brucella pituitosa]PJO50060.1 class GN sortase [Brucella pituitosa]PRA85502.1 class GN sortase [Ochrobactrum sp. MYb29]